MGASPRQAGAILRRFAIHEYTTTGNGLRSRSSVLVGFCAKTRRCAFAPSLDAIIPPKLVDMPAPPDTRRHSDRHANASDPPARARLCNIADFESVKRFPARAGSIEIQPTFVEFGRCPPTNIEDRGKTWSCKNPDDAAGWRTGNAAVYKTAMSRFDSGTCLLPNSAGPVDFAPGAVFLGQTKSCHMRVLPSGHLLPRGEYAVVIDIGSSAGSTEVAAADRLLMRARPCAARSRSDNSRFRRSLKGVGFPAGLRFTSKRSGGVYIGYQLGNGSDKNAATVTDAAAVMDSSECNSKLIPSAQPSRIGLGWNLRHNPVARQYSAQWTSKEKGK
jgi:hypothetical protein